MPRLQAICPSKSQPHLCKPTQKLLGQPTSKIYFLAKHLKYPATHTRNKREELKKRTCLLLLLPLHLHPSKYGHIPPKAAASTQPNPSLQAKSSSPSLLSSSSPPSRVSTSSAHTVSVREILVLVPAATRPRTATRHAKRRPGKQSIRESARCYGRGSRMKIRGGVCRRRQGR